MSFFRTAIQENIDSIRLQREVKEKSTKLTQLQGQYQQLEEVGPSTTAGIPSLMYMFVLFCAASAVDEGGPRPGGGRDGDAYIFDWASETFMETSYPGRVFDGGASCGFAKNLAGQEMIVIAGGDDLDMDTLIYDIESDSWSEADNLPWDLSRGTAVPYGDTFLIVGGQTTNGFANGILEFDPESFGWIARPERMDFSRFAAFAVFVEDDKLSCK